jgi:hypothetical protein
MKVNKTLNPQGYATPKITPPENTRAPESLSPRTSPMKKLTAITALSSLL